MDAVHANGSKFVWSIGGWSDCTETLDDENVESLADHIVQLIKVGKGDGVDFDWEHLSSNMKLRDQQTKTIAHVLLTIRKKLDAAGLNHIETGWTTRWNAFYDDETRPEGWKKFDSDGEGLSIEKEL